jgi:transposase-like protein
MNKMAQLNITLDTELLHGLFTKETKDEAFSKLLEEIFNQVLIAQSTEQLGAEPYERSDDRRAYRNGFLHFVFQGTEMAISAPPCLKDTSAVSRPLSSL